jgi:hypothetical protein
MVDSKSIKQRLKEVEADDEIGMMVQFRKEFLLLKNKIDDKHKVWLEKNKTKNLTNRRLFVVILRFDG